jgi:hypothetical protein
MGRTYVVKRRTIPNLGPPPFSTPIRVAESNPARVLSPEVWHD